MAGISGIKRQIKTCDLSVSGRPLLLHNGFKLLHAACFGLCSFDANFHQFVFFLKKKATIFTPAPVFAECFFFACSQ